VAQAVSGRRERAAARAAVAVAVALALVAGAEPAAAQPGLPDEDPAARVARKLASGLELFSELEYRAAIRELTPLRADPAATPAQRLKALELLAISYLILDQEELARQAFRDLLAIDAAHELEHDDGSPKIREVYGAVQGELAPGPAAGGRAELGLAPPREGRAGQRVEFQVSVGRGAADTREMILYWRRRGAHAFGAVPMRQVGEGSWRGRFETPAARSGYRLEYYIEARGVAGGVLGRAGGPEAPLWLALSGGVEAGPWYGRWYVLAGGAAVLGLGTVAVLAGRGGIPEGSLPPGKVTLSE
jgi:hypothetical protein